MGTRRARRESAQSRGTRSSLALVGVLALAGLLFTVNSQVSREHGVRGEGDLAGLVADEGELVRDLTAQVDALRTEVESLTDELDSSAAPPVVAIGAGRIAVSGPGLTVELDDAPTDAPLLPGVHPDDLVVHQQDLEAVVNALWSGGAEAMTVQGKRVQTTTVIRCVGNVLLLEGQVYSPPYVISAIGEPETLRAALDASPAVARYREWADAVGLGWFVTAPGQLDMPAAEGGSELRFARVPADVDVFAAALSGGPVPEETDRLADGFGADGR